MNMEDDVSALKASPAFPHQAFYNTKREGFVVDVAPGASIGAKRNAGALAVEAEFIASFDDDDFSLPHRLSTQLVR